MTKRALFLLAALAFAGCSTDSDDAIDPGGTPSDPQPGHAYLTIVGDRNVFLDGGSQQTLTVKYHDESGAPLAGQVHFRVDGTAAGSNLSSDSDVTSSDGLATVNIVGAADEAAFRVIAEAEYATPVDWRIAVSAADPPLPPLSAVGAYELDSQFDLASGIPGTAGTVINTFLDMTDDPNDPATWLLDQALAHMSPGTVHDAIESLRPGLDSFVNELILAWAPDFVEKLVQLGDDFGQIARKFGTTSDLIIAQGGPDGTELSGTHTLTGVVYTIDGTRYEYTMAELDLGEVSATGLQCSLEGDTQLLIGDHSLPFSYGHVLLFGLDHVIIPLIDPWSSSIEDLLHYYIDCYSLGYDLADYVGIGSHDFYESVCDTAIATASAYVEDQLTSIDGTAASLNIHGDAHAADTNGDRDVDHLQGGLWEGTMSFGPVDSTLAKPEQKFVGERTGLE